VDHFAAARALDIAGIDIYHPSQDVLTGTEIAFGGDMARSLKGTNYLVIETQAQAFPHWTPFPGQLRLQAFSHLASGANMVSYWHWHSIHNSFETYWKGLLSHDFASNYVYEEAKTIGSDFQRLSPRLVNLKKTNRVAVLVSNEALTALEWFRLPGRQKNYNDVVRLVYDALYRQNIACDFVFPASENFEDYDLLVVPALYSAPDSLLERLNRYVENGGHIVYTFKSGFTDDTVQVRTTPQPGIIREACGIQYSVFVEPHGVTLKDDPFQVGVENNTLDTWMELVTPEGAQVLAWYDHPHWGQYAAVTQNHFGKGWAMYIACLPSAAIMAKILARAARDAGCWGADQELAFPLITRFGQNEAGRLVHYYFNYSAGRQLISGAEIAPGQEIKLPAWGFVIIEEAA
jgi:beta-galactosidase